MDVLRERARQRKSLYHKPVPCRIILTIYVRSRSTTKVTIDTATRRTGVAMSKSKVCSSLRPICVLTDHFKQPQGRGAKSRSPFAHPSTLAKRELDLSNALLNLGR